MKRVLLFIFIVSVLCCITACDDGKINTMNDLEEYTAKQEVVVNEQILDCIKNKDADALNALFSKNSKWQTDFYLEKDIDEECVAFIKAFDDHTIVERVDGGGPALSGSETAQPLYIYGECELALNNGDKYQMEWSSCDIYDGMTDYLGLERLILKTNEGEVLAKCGNYGLRDYVEKQRKELLDTVKDIINTQNAQGLVDLVPEEYRGDNVMSNAEKCIEIFGGHKIKEMPEYTLDYRGGNIDETLQIIYYGFDVPLDDGRTFDVCMKYNIRDYDPNDKASYDIDSQYGKYGLIWFHVTDDKDNDVTL